MMLVTTQELSSNVASRFISPPAVHHDRPDMVDNDLGSVTKDDYR